MRERKAFGDITASERWLLSADGQKVHAKVAAKRSHAWSSCATPQVAYLLLDQGDVQQAREALGGEDWCYETPRTC